MHKITTISRNGTRSRNACKVIAICFLNVLLDESNARRESAANFAIRAVDNVNDHDINRPEALAVYTGVLKVEDATEWIKPRT